MPCPSCRSALPPGARFCPSCGSPSTPGPAMAKPTGRKVVTVLFCDLVGSTALSGTLDAETLRSVTLRWFDLMRLRIEDQGGTVEKFIGDAVMAVFGVPTVREDDARRALAAALAMREALAGLNARLEQAVGVRLEMRIGVNTGQVVTGSATLRQAMVSGEAVNVAARLEQNAAAGEILIGSDTLAAAGPGVRTADRGPLLLKGKSDRVHAHLLLGADEEEDPERLRRFDLGFVGRTHELAVLERALARVVGERRAGRLVVGGEAGQGKTRLVREWIHRTAATKPPRVTGTRAKAPIVAGPRAKAPMVTATSAMAAAAAARPRHGVGRCRARGEQPSLGPLADAVADLLKTGGRPAPSPELDLLDGGLLLDGTPTPSPADTCAALAKVLAELSATEPVVLVIDDCHWAAQPLFDTLERLLRALTDAAVLIVLLTRPHLFDTRPELAQDAVPLGGLSDAEAQLLAAELTGGAAGGEPLGPRVLARVGGNPLHLEQLLLAGNQVEADGVPLQLQALIGARIDALDPPEHRALGVASVLGGDFTADELTALAAHPAEAWTGSEVRSTLHRLVLHRLIRPDGEAFRFAGGLIQEVVYASQSKMDRADRHERAARLDSVRERGGAAVGAHLDHAYRYRVELGAQDPHTDGLRRRAADALAEAGRLALAHADPVWAADLLSRATARYAPGEPGGTATRRRLGQTLLDLGRGAEGRALLEALLAELTPSTPPAGSPAAPPGNALTGAEGARPDDTSAARSDASHGPLPDGSPLGAPGGAAVSEVVVEAAHARLALASVGPSAGRGETPAEAAGATLPVFAAAGDDLGQAKACLRLAQGAQEQGRHRKAERLLARALDHAVRADAEPERAAALGATGVSLWRGPQPVADAVARCRELLTDQGAGRRAVRLTLNCPLAVLLALHDDRDGALACLAEAEQLAKRLGYAEADAFLPIFAATVADLAGRPDQALLSLERAAASARELGATALLRSALLDTARIRVDLGDWRTADAALAELEGTRAEAARPRAEAADLDGLRARIAAARGQSTAATRLAARALATAARTDSPIVRGLAALDLARTELVLGHPAEASDAATRARAYFAAKGHLPAVRQAEAVTKAVSGTRRPTTGPESGPARRPTTGPESGPEPCLESGSEPGPTPGPEAVTEPRPQPAPRPGPGPEHGPGPGPEPRSGPGSATESATGSGPWPVLGPESATGSGPWPVLGPESATGSGPWPGLGPRSVAASGSTAAPAALPAPGDATVRASGETARPVASSALGETASPAPGETANPAPGPTARPAPGETVPRATPRPAPHKAPR
ncbi:adenylate/guanylate cyclase domain-containing protein [Streptomyces sp. NPDC058700]|uniref:adenylate/guanylate cyclase domain-containing protein n=1 Tax=Streptomyces sp. NPDC058700 TaxID=3346607 RepID=UPI003666AD90